MKFRFLPLLFGLGTLVSCGEESASEYKSPTADSLTVLGGDRDEHGCIGSAGQVWSVVKNSCIQVFAEGERLDPVENGKSAIISAFVVAKADSSQLELFLAELEKAPILKQTDAFVYTFEQYTYNAKNKELTINDTLRYRGK
jgi:hypothetical protein